VAQIRPFRGLVYDVSRAGAIGELITPPYDVISPERQKAYHDRNPHNIIHLDFGLERPGDDERENKYVRAARMLDEWLDEGSLLRGERPAFYVLEQEYTLEDGRRRKRTGFIGLVKLEELGSGKVLPHERTLSKPRADRLNLLRATRANLSQVFALFGDPAGGVEQELEKASRRPPLFEVDDYQRVTNRLWVLEDEDAIRRVSQVMRDKVLFIADGHHRYETALAYRDEMRKTFPGARGDQPYDYVMMMMVNMDVQEMTILPTHRVVRGLPAGFEEDFLGRSKEFFDVLEVDRGQVHKKVSEMQDLPVELHQLGFLGKEGPLRLLRLKDHGIMGTLVPPEYSDALRMLDVTVLHSLVFDHLLGIDTEIALLRGDISFEKSTEACARQVEDGHYQAAFFLRGTKMEQMREIAARRERMPQKSTFFYPKLPTGLVMYRLD